MPNVVTNGFKFTMKVAGAIAALWFTLVVLGLLAVLIG
jgi:hypothetical protein